MTTAPKPIIITYLKPAAFRTPTFVTCWPGLESVLGLVGLAVALLAVLVVALVAVTPTSVVMILVEGMLAASVATPPPVTLPPVGVGKTDIS